MDNKEVEVHCRKKGERYGKPNKQFGAYPIGVQVSHRVLPEKKKKNHLAGVHACREDLRENIRTLCQYCKYKGVEIMERHMMPDHVHLL